MYLRLVFVLCATIELTGCYTAVALLDTAGSAAVYTGKTTIKTIDKLTPDFSK